MALLAIGAAHLVFMRGRRGARTLLLQGSPANILSVLWGGKFVDTSADGLLGVRQAEQLEVGPVCVDSRQTHVYGDSIRDIFQNGPGNRVLRKQRWSIRLLANGWTSPTLDDSKDFVHLPCSICRHDASHPASGKGCTLERVAQLREKEAARSGDRIVSSSGGVRRTTIPSRISCLVSLKGRCHVESKAA